MPNNPAQRKPIRVLVCGGRNYDDKERIHEILYKIHAKHMISRVIHGGAQGADSIAEEWATSHYIHVDAYPANWELYGRKAGAIRNTQMLKESKPDAVVAFPGGKGTADMVSKARKAGVKVWVIKE